MGKNDIRLSPKYGVNPTIPICFWCGKERGDLALLGRIGNGRKGEDIEAPIHMVIDYEPCDKCREGMERGVMCFEATETPTSNNTRPMTTGCYPTGRWCVITEEAAKRIFPDIGNNKRLRFLPKDFQEIFGGVLDGSD